MNILSELTNNNNEFKTGGYEMNNLDNWNNWKSTLGKATSIGENLGMSQNTMTSIAEGIGTFLANNVDPRNDEERLLKELWDVANEHDKHVLAKLVVKITQQ